MDMDIFEALRKDHQTQRRLAELLCKTHGESEGRKELFARLKSELSRHAAAEERYFYAPLFENDLTQTRARHSVAEHHELDELVESLEATPMQSSGWVATARTLRDRLLHHLDEEEREVFQLAGKVLNASQKRALAEEYRQEMDRAA